MNVWSDADDDTEVWSGEVNTCLSLYVMLFAVVEEVEEVVAELLPIYRLVHTSQLNI